MKLIDPAPKTEPPGLEAHHKMLKIRRLSDAIVRVLAEPRTHATAMQLQQLQRDRKALRETMPPLRLVIDE